MIASDSRYMQLALALGQRGLGQVWPNPAVGCVIVSKDRIVGRGWTQPGGRPHAETMALTQAGDAARGASAYVSLEPCAHHGKTPPCTEALIAAGVTCVVSAMQDPDPRVAGKGHAALQAAGIAVKTGMLEAAARQAHAGFLSRVNNGRPWVTLKLASSVDGRIATATGESQWITGPHARRAVHAMRMKYDAVMVGGGTARADNPMLTARDMGAAHQPVRIVVSCGLDLARDGALARSAAKIPLWLAHGQAADTGGWANLGARLIAVPKTADGVDVSALMFEFGKAGLTRILCEGGGKLAASLLAAGLVDELVVFHAGLALGASGLPSVAPLPFEHLTDAPRFALAELRQVGADSLQIWRRN